MVQDANNMSQIVNLAKNENVEKFLSSQNGSLISTDNSILVNNGNTRTIVTNPVETTNLNNATKKSVDEVSEPYNKTS